MKTEAEILVLGEAIGAPEGYRLDALAAATYSLDLGVALGIPLGSIRNGEFAGIEVDESSRWALLEALRTVGSRYRVFCDAGGIRVPPRRLQRVTQLLGGIVVPVSMPMAKNERRPSFHPKFLLARYVCKGLRPRLKLVCMSRNLSVDASLDISVVVEGTDTGRTLRRQGSHRLADALRHLPSWTPRRYRGGDTQNLIDTLSTSVERTKWQPPNGFDEVKLWPFGFGDTPDPMPPRHDETEHLIISPFLDRTRLTALRRNGGRQILISDRRALQGIDPVTIGQYEVYVFGGFAPDLSELDPSDGVAETDEVPQTQDAPTSGLHTKLYVAKGNGRKARLVAGSANATMASISRNAELMVECSSASGSGRFSIDSLLDPEGDIGRFLTRWEPEADEAVEEAEGTGPAEVLFRELAGFEFTGEIVEKKLDDYDVSVDFNGGDQIRVPDGGRISASMGDSEPMPVALGGHPAATLKGLTRRQLSTFIALRVDLSGDSYERLLPIHLSGFDLEALQMDLIKGGGGEESILAYIAFVLDGVDQGAGAPLDFGKLPPMSRSLGATGSAGVERTR